MTTENKVALRMEGLEKTDHHLDLSVFTKKAGQFYNLLKRITQEHGGGNVIFRVTSLTHSSPAEMGCVPYVNGSLAEAAIINQYEEIFDSIGKREADHISHPILMGLEELANLTAVKSLAILTTSNGEKRTLRFDKEFRDNLTAVRRSEVISLGTADGKLEQVNIHGKVKKFTVYTFSSPVKCQFDKALLTDVQKALGKYVSVSGRCFFRPDAAMPYEIEASSMEILPDTEDLPSLYDLHGIAPNATGNKTTEQHIRDLRDEWEHKA